MTKYYRPRGLVVVAILSFGLGGLFSIEPVPVLAQATTGTIKGTVTDQTGAVISGATITVKNQATGVEAPIYKSSSSGIYTVPSLIPGSYTLTAESKGFKRSVFTDIDVKLGQDTVIDVAMQPGGVTEEVTVTANTETVVQKDTSQISTNFKATQVEDLPTNVAGSGIDTIALLVPGVTPGFGNVNSNGTTLSVNGNRARSNNFTIDGQDNNDLSIGGPSVFIDNQDLVAEYQVITNNFSAQYGRNQGAIVNIVTKSGTNEFHGSAFEFHRDASLTDSLDNIEKASGQTGPNPLLYNVYGGTLGGPIIKNKAFFFGSYQGIQTRQLFTDTAGVTSSPRLAILPQDLPALVQDFPGNPAIAAYAKYSAFALQDFGTVTAVPGSQDTITLGGHKFLAALPKRTFEEPLATPYNENEFSGRGDIKLSSKDNFWTRYFFQQNNFKNALGSVFGFTGDVPARSQILGATWDHQVSGTALNDFSFSWTHLFVKFGGGCTNLTACIPDPSMTDQAFTNIAFPGVTGDNTGLQLQTIGPATNLPQGRTVTAIQFHDNYSFIHGRHQFMAGADIRRLLNDNIFLPDVNGAFSFRSPAQLLANDPQNATVGLGNTNLKFDETDQFYFFQDDWKIRDNLTLNLGIRYEFTGQPINVLHDLTLNRESVPSTAFWLQSLPLSARTVPRIPADTNNWAPRFGFAYTPRFWKRIFGDDSTVFRGGYSIAYDPAFYNILVNVATSSPSVFLLPIVNPAPGGSGAVFSVPNNAFGPQVRAAAQSQGFLATNTFDPRFFSQVAVAPNFHSPYAEQWSFGIERQINRNNVLEVRYLGTHGVGLFQNIVANPDFGQILNGFTLGGTHFPGFPNLVPSGLSPQVAGQGACIDNPATPINEATACNGRIFPQARVLSRNNGAQSIYHSLQVRYNGRIGNQLTLGGVYTLSKSLDNASAIFAFQENSTAQDPFNTTSAERSYSGFDRRNQIALNFIWDVPFFRAQKGLLGHVAGGWQLNGIYVIDSGLRYTPVQFFNDLLPPFQSYIDPFGGDNLKPFVGNPSADPTQVAITDTDAAFIFGTPTSPTGYWSLNALNKGQLKAVTPNDVRYIENMPGADARFGTPFGNVARNSLVGPRINQLNLGIFKNNHITEHLNLQLRLEVFNALNHPQPGYGYVNAGLPNIPDNLIEDAGSTFNNTTQMEFARRAVQLGVRFVF